MRDPHTCLIIISPEKGSIKLSRLRQVPLNSRLNFTAMHHRGKVKIVIFKKLNDCYPERLAFVQPIKLLQRKAA